MMPIAKRLLSAPNEVRERFVGDLPLPDFVVVTDFLETHLASEVLREALDAPYATWCGYSLTGKEADLKAHFCEPNDQAFFVTVHQRPTRPIPLLDKIGKSFAQPEVMQALREMTGLPLNEMRPFGSEILTRWTPGSFLNAHTDAGPKERPTQLVISLSLTANWCPDFGGSTMFKWEGSDQSIETWPLFNSAVLFRAHPGSTHWVNRVEDHARSSRFTFTLHFT